MTDQRSPLDEHTDQFASALSAGRERLTRARRQRRRAAALGVPLVIAASLGAALWPGQQANVLDRAEAALSPKGAVIHYRIVTTPTGDLHGVCPQGPVDIWQEVGPNAGPFPRWRTRTSRPARCDGRGLTSALGFVNTGRSDTWFDGRDRSEFAPDDGWVEHITKVTDINKHAPSVTDLLDVPAPDGQLGPIAWLRGLLRLGVIHSAGQGTIDGRHVRFLSGEIRRQEAPNAAPYRRTIRVAVDRDSFAPVEVIQRFAPVPSSLPPGTDALKELKVRFLLYSTAPISELAPRIPSGTRAASMDYRALRKVVRHSRHYPARPVTDAERRRSDARLVASGQRRAP